MVTLPIIAALLCPQPNGMVAITADDHYRSQYEILRPILEERGIPATLAITPLHNKRVFGSRTAFTFAQLVDMHDRLGWALINHTVSHTNLSTVGSPADVEAQVMPVVDWFVDQGFTRDEEHLFFAYPNGATGEIAEEALRVLGFRAARRSSGGNEPFPVEDRFEVRAVGLGQTATAEDGIACVDQAAAENGLCVIVLHSLADEPSTPLDYRTEYMVQVADRIAELEGAGTLRAVTFPEAFR